MFSAVEMILTKVSKNREKNRRHTDRDDGVGSSDTGTARRRRQQEQKKRFSSSEESSTEEDSSSKSSTEDSYSSEENSDSSSRVRKRRELRKAEKKKSDRRSERKQSTASSKSKSSKSGRGRKMSGTIDRKSRHDEDLQPEPELRMSRRYKSEELLNVSDDEAPKLTQSSRAISTLSLKDDQERKVKQKQIFMELKRKQEKERKDQLAEQRRLKQEKEQRQMMDTISQVRSAEGKTLQQVSDRKQTQSHSTSQQFAVREELPSNSKRAQEKQWKETSLDSEGSEEIGKKKVPVVPPKPRKKRGDNQSSDSLNDFSSRENIVDNIGSHERGIDVIHGPPHGSGARQMDPEQGRIGSTVNRGDKLASVPRFGASKENASGSAFAQTRGAYYSSSMPRTQHKGQSLAFPRPYKPPQTTGSASSTVRTAVNMGYQGDQTKRNSGVVYQVLKHGAPVHPYNGDVRASPTPSNQTIGDFRRNEVSRTINYGHLAQQRADLV